VACHSIADLQTGKVLNEGGGFVGNKEGAAGVWIGRLKGKESVADTRLECESKVSL
jgi:hypothetical protein